MNTHVHVSACTQWYTQWYVQTAHAM